MKSNDASAGSLVAAPPARQLSPPQLQLTSFGCSLSAQSGSEERNAGAITRVSPSAPARTLPPPLW